LYGVKQLGLALFSATGGLSSHSYLTVISDFPRTLKPLFTVHLFSRTGVPNISLTTYPFIIPTDEHVPFSISAD